MTCSKSIINNNWYVSFGDFLTLILCFFLVIIANTFKKNLEKTPIVDDKKQVIFSLNKNDLKFTLPQVFKDNLYVASLESSLLKAEEKRENYILKLNVNNLNKNNNTEKIIKILNELSLPNEYQFKVLNLGNFKTFNDFLNAKRQLSDAGIDISELKMSHTFENELILIVYKK